MVDFFQLVNSPGARWELQHKDLLTLALVFAPLHSEEQLTAKVFEITPANPVNIHWSCFYNRSLEILGQGATLCKTEEEWAEWDSQPQTESFTIV